MKNILVSFFLVAFCFSVNAQNLIWKTDLNEAIKISEETQKPIMMFFTGSDWCGWCKRLQSEVFTKPEFAAWANQNVVLMEVDFPRRTALSPEMQSQNNQLQQFFGVQGYPTVWFVNAARVDGKVNFSGLGSTGYVPGGPAAWLEAANAIIKKK